MQKTIITLQRGIAVFLFLALQQNVTAQFIDDALRLAEPAQAFNPRSAAMGNAFLAVADDFSALQMNPAGLGQMKSKEFALGMTSLSTKTTTTFLGSTAAAENSGTHLNSIGFVLPFPVTRGSLVFAAGYQRILDYTNALSFDGYNSQSSIMPTLYDNDVRYDLAWQLGLEDTNAVVPITNNVNQEGEVLESGKLGQWSFGGSIEVARNAFLGVSLNILSGSYSYERDFIETDPNNSHQGIIAGKDFDRTDFQQLHIEQSLSQEFSGFSAKIGFLYRMDGKARFGVTIQTPLSVEVTESYLQEGKSTFGDATERYSIPDIRNSYGVITPWIFSVGASYNPVDFVTIAGEADFTDFTQLEFDDTSNRDILGLNKDIRKMLRSTTSYRFGAEIRIPETGLQIRGGYGVHEFPYENKPSQFNSQTISAGVGYLIENAFLINAAYVRTTREDSHFNYSDLSAPESALRTDEDLTRSRIMFSISYLF